MPLCYPGFWDQLGAQVYYGPAQTEYTQLALWRGSPGQFGDDWATGSLLPLEFQQVQASSHALFDAKDFKPLQGEGWILATQAPGTIPLYLWAPAPFNFDPLDQDHYTTTLDGSPGNEIPQQHKFRIEGIVGYIFEEQQPGTIPLDVYRGLEGQILRAHLTTTDVSIANDDPNISYHYRSTLGYVYAERPWGTEALEFDAEARAIQPCTDKILAENPDANCVVELGFVGPPLKYEVTGTDPLNTYVDEAGENYMTSSRKESQQQAMAAGFTLLRTEGYVYPASFQMVRGFEGDAPSDWSSTVALGTSDNATEGEQSLSLGCGWGALTSQTFSTADFNVVGDKLALDVFVPDDLPNPYWIGTVGMQLNIPAADLNDAPLGTLQLLSTGWRTLEFPVTAQMREAVLSDLPNAQLKINANTILCSEPLLIDNLRFIENTEPVPAHVAGGLASVAPGSLFSFESLADWSSNDLTLSQSSESTHGSSSLNVTTVGWQSIVSREFTAYELPVTSGTLSVDVFVPSPQPNPYWVGDLIVALDCPTAGVDSAQVGQAFLTDLFYEEWNTLSFAVSAAHQQAITGGASCQIQLILNTNATGGEFLIDNMGFAP